jgi:hypothetical protein
MMTRTQVLSLTWALAVSLGSGPLLADVTPAAETAANEAPLSLDDCRKIWNLAAGRSDLGPDGSKPYIDDFATVDTNGDGKITNAEFRAGCEKGFVHPARRAD